MAYPTVRRTRRRRTAADRTPRRPHAGVRTAPARPAGSRAARSPPRHPPRPISFACVASSTVSAVDWAPAWIATWNPSERAWTNRSATRRRSGTGRILAGRAAGQHAVDAALRRGSARGADGVLVEVVAAVGERRHRGGDRSGEHARDAIDPWFPVADVWVQSQACRNAATSSVAPCAGRASSSTSSTRIASRWDEAQADGRQLRGPSVLVRARGPRNAARDRRRRRTVEAPTAETVDGGTSEMSRRRAKDRARTRPSRSQRTRSQRTRRWTRRSGDRLETPDPDPHRRRALSRRSPPRRGTAPPPEPLPTPEPLPGPIPKPEPPTPEPSPRPEPPPDSGAADPRLRSRWSRLSRGRAPTAAPELVLPFGVANCLRSVEPASASGRGAAAHDLGDAVEVAGPDLGLMAAEYPSDSSSNSRSWSRTYALMPSSA